MAFRVSTPIAGGAHTANAQEYRQRADDVLAAVAAGIIKPTICIKPTIWNTYPLDRVADAHAALEQGKSAGAIVLRP